ncbi:MAG: hypothetical protein AAFR46_20965, partial [Pseudomonadota bacterium]
MMTVDDDLARPASWLAAERQLTRPLAQLAGLQARLDERLAALDTAVAMGGPAAAGGRGAALPGSGSAISGSAGSGSAGSALTGSGFWLGGAGPALTRLAGEEAVALARAAGARLPLESFLLWRHGAPIRRADPADLARAGWAARRLAAPPQALAEALRDPAGLRRFLGLAGGLPGQDAGALGDG